MKVAFVVQRCGREVNGGAETLCLQVAQRMARHWQTEILTTCALDYMRWDNHYPEGTETIGNTVIRRFRVDRPRDVAKFNELSDDLHARQSQVTLAEQEQWMRTQGPLSSDLIRYLEEYQSDYDAFLFFGYLYATTYFGLPLVAPKAFLVPCAHDEWTIHLPMWDNFVKLPRVTIFNTDEERAFFQRRFSTRIDGPVIGIGLSEPTALDPASFREKYGLRDPFLLYAGRIDESKGCAELFDWFRRLRAMEKVQRKLILLGKEVLAVPYHPDIIHLGYVTEEEKWNAMAACDWLVQPSLYESLSIVLLETWLAGRPVIVNGRCEVLVAHCRRSNGGIWYRDFEEWSSCVSLIPETIKTSLGRQGQRYVREHYGWQRVETEFIDLMNYPRRKSVRSLSNHAALRNVDGNTNNQK